MSGGETLLQLDLVRQQLPEFDLQWHDEVASTMPLAAALAREGAPHLTVVGAEAQTAGVGRYRRPWHSAPGTGLYFTILLRPKLQLSDIPAVTLALGLAVATAMEADGFQPDLRWPNDVLLAGKKVAGILTQLEGDCVVAGIGLNVNTPRFPEELTNIATSMRLVAGKVVPREPLLVGLLSSIRDWCVLLQSRGREAIFQAFQQHSTYVRGRRVVVEQSTGLLRGTTAGLTAAGYLLVRDAAGQTHEVVAGGVRPDETASDAEDLVQL